jgi:hypothetical protein
MHYTASRLAGKCVMLDHGFFLSWQAVRRQLAAMPNDLYLVRLIHQTTRRAFPGERLWTAAQLVREPTIRFLRSRNREGCDIYIQPYAGSGSAGYILLDLDHGGPAALDLMRTHGHAPCVVLQTSFGHLQAWIRVSADPLEPAIAGAIAKHLARLYGADLASADWRHLGRLAGFTNQKPLRRQRNGAAPWVRLVLAELGLASRAAALVEAAGRQVARDPTGAPTPDPPVRDLPTPVGQPSRAGEIYQAWLYRLRIPQRFPQPDWSIADQWIAKELLRQGAPRAAVEALLRWGSPGFPRGHAAPADYLRRTLTRALGELGGRPFSAPCGHCVADLWPAPGPGHTLGSEIHAGPPADCCGAGAAS